MKRLVFILPLVLLATVVLPVGCTKGIPTAIVQTITGEVEYLTVPLAWGETVPLEYGNANETATMTVKTPQGLQTIRLADNTTYSIDGQACKLQDIGKALEEGNTTYNCSIVIAPCEPEGFVARYLSVFTITK